MIIGVIPARAGSERLPGKNKADLGGWPLVKWTIEAAKKSEMFDQIVISTDDPEIMQIAYETGCVLHPRLPALTGPEIDLIKVLLDVCLFIDSRPEIIVLLQPTSPFRTHLDIVAAIEGYKASGGDALISVTEPSGDLVFEIGHAGRLRPSHGSVVANGAVYVTSGDHLVAGGTWFNGVTYSYFMPKNRSLDIDTKNDLEIARMMVKQGLHYERS